MPFACRIDDVIVSPGRLEIKYTAGRTPLPGAWQGEGLNFTSRADLAAQMDELESRLGSDLVMLMVAIAVRADPDLGAQAVAKIEGHGLVLDLTAAANIMRLV